ncbi:TLC domain [Seminavis robusta]|uniref:TLC domain n=1 Tax=Seminavis robusta TaxID=568900 RepID=A0A9N8E1Z0_9STRA|nr:TLC domain [Seminavis robusta]|eukprot:Sro476_g150630.1 TLC domain (299) ;mRNA; r:58990-60095
MSVTTTKTVTKHSHSNEVPPQIPSGFSKMGPSIAGYFGCLTAVYAAIYFGYLDSDSVLGSFKPSPEYCTSSETPCSRSDLFAFQISSGIAISFCGVLGFYTWHVSKRVHTALPATPEGRLFGYLPESEQLAAINFSFQFWDFFISLLIPEHRTPLMLGHHTAASVVCFMSLQHQMLHYYGVFFLGVTEFSSLFLVLIDLAKFFPPEPETTFDTISGLCGPLFAASFTVYRVVLWWKVSLLLWQDCYHVVTKGSSDALRPGKNYVLYIFLFLNVPLGLLQLYWFGIILDAVRNILAGDA